MAKASARTQALGLLALAALLGALGWAFFAAPPPPARAQPATPAGQAAGGGGRP